MNAAVVVKRLLSLCLCEVSDEGWGGHLTSNFGAVVKHM